MKHAASPAGATDNLLLAVFNDLPPVAQGITALRRPPFKDECIQRFAHPLRERGFMANSRGTGGEQQDRNDGKDSVCVHDNSGNGRRDETA